MPRLQGLLRKLPPGFAITLADIGSAGGLKDRWLPAASRVQGLLFEPRESGSPVMQSGRNRSYPVALAEQSGTRELHLTAMANMSSLLEPNAPLLERFRKKGAHARVERRITVPVQPLDALLQQEGLQVDVLKVDTQGSELAILQGAVQALEHSVVLAEVEVSFIERYSGQALAAELLAWMQARGFQLIEIYRLKRYRWRNALGVGNVGIGGGHRAGQLAYGDAIFMASDDLLARRWATQPAPVVRQQLLSLLVALLVYGKLDTAAATLERHAALLDDDARQVMQAWLSRWRRAEYGVRGLHVILDFIARKV